MKLNHIDLQVPDVVEAVTFFERWFAFTLTTSRTSPALAILHGADGFVLVLQRSLAGGTYPDKFHIGFILGSEALVTDFHERARAAALEVSDVLRNGRGTQVYFRGPGGILVEVSCPRASVAAEASNV